MEGQFAAETLSAIGLLALLIAVVTELTKNLPRLKTIPTDLQALAEGVVFSLAMVLCGSGGVGWQQVGNGLVRGVFAAFVATYGWEKLGGLAQRLLHREEERHG